MSQVPENLQYTAAHEWVANEGNGVYKVGITEHAQQLLGDLVFVELPDVDKNVVTGDETGVVESVKAASDVYAPVTGVITSVNDALVDSPELVNESPYEEGWLYTVKVSDEQSLSALLSAEQYSAKINDED